MSATIAKPASMWSPLAQPVFRALWLASAVSSIGTWMHDVGAAWLMTSLSPSPLLIAMMQAASSLPFFMLALPAGAIADVVDRRRLLLFTQGWMLAAATLLGILTVANITTPWILLALTFAISIGSAVNMPVWQAITPELVAKEQLPSAVTLTGIVINLSRSVGPALAGIVIASAGTGFVFLLNAASFVGVILVVFLWRRKTEETALPAERFIGAMQAGVRYVRYSPPFQKVLVRAAAYIFFASALFAMLPLLGRKELGLDAFRYGIILGFWGIGGLAGAFILPKIRQRISTDLSVAIASATFGMMMLVLSYTRNFYAVCAAMLVVGLSSLTAMVSLNVAAQTAVPIWVRARALATYLLVFQGSMTLGSLLWGTIAQNFGISASLNIAGAGAIATTLLTVKYRLKCAEKMDLTASLHWQQPAHSFEPCPDDGPVLITLEYRIDPANASSFKQAMKALSHTRRRDGAIHWGLYQDLSDCQRFVETIIVESWAEHQRQFERVTNSDRAIEDTARAFHIGDKPPKVTQMIYDKCNGTRQLTVDS
jgi:MFS family permease